LLCVLQFLTSLQGSLFIKLSVQKSHTDQGLWKRTWHV